MHLYSATPTSISPRMAIARKIIGFHRDEEQHWVADLECGHTQHVRHDPPWQKRHWVTYQSGREDMLGTTLNCKLCDDETSAR